jgi:hypothetical protein
MQPYVGSPKAGLRSSLARFDGFRYSCALHLASPQDWSLRPERVLSRRLTHVIGFDDAPFAEAHLGDVLIVGAVYAGEKLSGVVTGKVRRDGANATRVLAALGPGFTLLFPAACGLSPGNRLGGFQRSRSQRALYCARHSGACCFTPPPARERNPACASRPCSSGSAQVAPDSTGWSDGARPGAFCSTRRAFPERCGGTIEALRYHK